ncbi:AAA family ATPase [Trabulsiella odontotermitis]|uniref:AAA family ATPase n=1 Tax=Trabulsiella odontotermitis TaxID=379893 RepID=UPI0024B672D6|nr:AAA family ATPase [Trabulsiella odontotermitis]WHP32769.1 AAA family ATPase [Trabulsiella odontotermitis]
MQQVYRLESVTLKGIGVFEHTHIDFPPIKHEGQDARKAEIHIFTGPNGCGKSTMLYALASILDFGREAYALIQKRYHSKESCVCFQFAGIKGMNLIAHQPLPSGYKKILSSTGYQIVIEQNAVDNLVKNQPYLNVNDSLNIKSFDFAAFAYSGSRNQVSNFEVTAIQEVKQSPFEHALSFSNTVRPQILTQWIANNRTKAALARAEESEDEALSYDSALERISQFIQDVCGIEAVFQLKRNPLTVVINVEGESIAFDTLPEGLKSIITWVADLALRLEGIPWKEKKDIFSQPIILFLDEVDIHLHPKWQRRILPAIQKLLPNAQVFVSTHSPFVVGSVEDAFVYRLPEPQHNVCRDPSVPDIVSAIDSKAGKSYQLILSDVFGIDEEFDVETEEQLAAFKAHIREHLVTGQHNEVINSLAKTLSDKGEELSEIVRLELRQMQRQLSKKQG